MNLISIPPFFVVIAIALIAIDIFNRFIKISIPKGRYSSIDGLRGYLALFVFIHHSIVWHFYILTGNWAFPPSNLYNHLGPTSVGLFFMITSFLFVSKLIDAKHQSIDWIRLYISRIFRIIPLYAFIFFIVFIIVMTMSQWRLIEPIEEVLYECIQWLCFIQTEINGYPETRLIVARVIWSLAFEWMFYFSLPLLAIFLLKIRVSILTLLISLIFLCVFIFIIWQYYPIGAIRRLCPFLGGIAAAFISRFTSVRDIVGSKYISIAIIGLVICAVCFFPDAYSIIPYLCMVFTFIAIGAGNTLFGILTNNLSQLLGQISYSIYLMHGICLYVALRCIPGLGKWAVSEPDTYWLFIGLTCVFLIFICSITYKFIEQPFINATPKVSKRIKDYLEDGRNVS